MPNDAGLDLPPSHYITNHYQDVATGKNEVVFSHEPEDNHGPEILARAIQRTKEMLEREAKKIGSVAHFCAILDYDKPISTQFNISLWRGETNVLAEYMKDSICKGDVLAACMLPYMKDTSLLMLPSENSMKRLNFRGKRYACMARDFGDESRARLNKILAVRCEGKDIQHSTRIETRLAGSDASPHLAMIAGLHSVYYGLSNLASKDCALRNEALINPSGIDIGPISQNHNTILQLFEEDKYLMEMLNQLDDQGHNLGTRIKAMALEYAKKSKEPEQEHVLS